MLFPDHPGPTVHDDAICVEADQRLDDLLNAFAQLASGCRDLVPTWPNEL
jgi:hypothetical protein